MCEIDHRFINALYFKLMRIHYKEKLKVIKFLKLSALPYGSPEYHRRCELLCKFHGGQLMRFVSFFDI